MDAERSYASKGVAGTALGLSIGALGVEVLRGGLNGLLTGNPAPAAAPAAPAATATTGNDVLMAAIMAAAANKGNCNEDHTVKPYVGPDPVSIPVKAPVIGVDLNLKFTQKDLDTLYRYIMEA